ncbi:hypothetical protein [Gayadomonas joobiniege]|uniref:hypothetical protein n=1 Tax=Gayadomonas joobiniege TaxID=1234606 RepID=UPI0003633DFE|nr:hypothetical protein [Gayadomonas joobiniege]
MLGKIIRLVKNLNNVTKEFDTKVYRSVRRSALLSAALSSDSRIISDEQLSENELIVSLTTYSKRIHDIHLVIESIAQQTVKPNRVILWLDKDEFTSHTIPELVKKQMTRGLEVRFCENYRSYTKFIPTLREFPDADIITIDDDILYPHDTIELLYREHLEHPDAIIGSRAHKIITDANGKVLPYRQWEYETKDHQKSANIIALGVGGVYYPAKSLSDICLDIDSFRELAPHADDIWFKAMSLLNNRVHKKVKDDREFDKRFLLLEDAQDIALSKKNVHEDRNDPQVQAVFSKYNLFDKLSQS